MVTLSVGPLLVAALIGIIPMNDDELFKERVAISQQLASSTTPLLERRDHWIQVERKYAAQHELDPSLQSLRISRFDGIVFYETDNHSKHWTLKPNSQSTLNEMRVPIFRNRQEWAYAEITFHPLPWYKHGWQRIAALVGIALILNGISFLTFLNRVLSVLDPNSAVPRRVRNTLDTIAGGVVVLDASGKIMIANESFTKSLADESENIVGSKLDGLPWRFAEPTNIAPWDQVLIEKKRSEGTKIFLPCKQGVERCFVVNATPVMDANERLAGALISFEDVTTLEEQRKTLVQAMSELEVSREQIREQNTRLQELALRDALTGAYNRRALYERMEEMWGAHHEADTSMVTVMMDVDHFKKLNDRYGHAAGDAVLKDVVKVLQATVADRGFVGRYGGEEFVVLIPNCDVHEGVEIGENIRKAIQRDLAKPYAVTTSVGVSCSSFGAASVQALLEQADKSLYGAKHSGRNNVKHWTPEIDALEETNKKKALEAQNLSLIDDHPISYHAVVSLHAALTYRHADTAIHSQRVAELSVGLGRGLMPVSKLYMLEIAALLHDIGKIGVPDAVLLKPGRLTDDEWKYMEAHGPIGEAIVEAAFDCPDVTDVLKYHHCRFDGKNNEAGMPSGKDIPLNARIVCIVDAFDAMVSDRVYRKGRTHEEAFAELRRCAGGQFDPDLVERFIRNQVGWRIDSRLIATDVTDRDAVSLGYHLERVLHSFEIRDPTSLKQRLEILKSCAHKCDMQHIAMIAADLAKDAERKSISDYESLMPMLQSLIEVCLSVQRAYLRQVGSRPIDIEDCNSQYFMHGTNTVHNQQVHTETALLQDIQDSIEELAVAQQFIEYSSSDIDTEGGSCGSPTRDSVELQN